MRRGNEDKNAFLDVIVKTSNPTLIPHSSKKRVKYVHLQTRELFLSLMWVRCLLRAKLKYHCKAPGKHSLPPYMSNTVAAEMHSGWDLNQLKKGNEQTIKGTILSSLLMNIQHQQEQM